MCSPKGPLQAQSTVFHSQDQPSSSDETGSTVQYSPTPARALTCQTIVPVRSQGDRSEVLLTELNTGCKETLISQCGLLPEMCAVTDLMEKKELLDI